MHLAKKIVKKLLVKIAPAFAAAWEARRADKHGQALMRKLGMPQLIAKYTALQGWEVKGGPFKGMKMLEESAGSALLPKLIGSYEQELQPAIEKAKQTQYDLVIDVGSAEGYYAIGLAKYSQHKTKVIAYDIDPHARKLCQLLSEENGVGSVVGVWGACSSSQLAGKTCGRRAFVLSDCEGFEELLFDQSAIEALKYSDVLIELHEAQKPGVTNTLTHLFANSHFVVVLEQQDRVPQIYPAINDLNELERTLALSEFRATRMAWLHAVARQKNV